MPGTDASADARADARAARLELEALLDEAPQLAVTLPPGYADAVERYVALLLEANRRVNLTRVVVPREVAIRHLLDALSALPLLDAWSCRDVIDLGSGGGVPALPLALARPAVTFTCVDSVRKKAAALGEMARALELDNVQIVAERAEALGRDARHRERHATVTARACAPLPVLVELAMPLIAVGGHLLAWKGPADEADEELRRGTAAAAQVGGGAPQVVGTGLAALGGRRFAVIAKERPTPGRFPRRAGEPGRRPLG